MSRRRVSSMIRRFGSPYWLKSREVGGELSPVNVYLKPGHETLQATDPLTVGDLIASVADPLRQYLITESRPGAWYDEFTIAKIGHHAQLFRYSLEQGRDTFGRVVAETPTMVYSDVPLVVLPAISDRDQDTDARSATETDYIFQTQDIFEILPKDRLTVSGLNLVVQSIQLSAAGLRKFTASVVQ